MNKIPCNLLLVLLVIANAVALDDKTDFFVGRQQVPYKAAQLSEDKFLTFSNLSEMQHFRNVLKNIMIPRVVGSEGHTKVRHYIKNSLEDLKWSVTLDKFHETAPILGKLHFQNIIATLNPNANRFLVLACHYDSKYMPELKPYEFVGATDSAVPCAMLINLAYVLHEQLQQFRNSDLSLMLLFFDGEEAFEQWGPFDSIFGARHLAKKWHNEKFLDKIDMLVLLDLIGAPDPKFYSFFANTEAWHSRLVDIEERLANVGLLEQYTSSGVARYLPNRYFQPNSLRDAYIEDDHIPFLKRNVPILHLIPVPFPEVWHTKEDDAEVVDYVTTENISRIIRIFTMEYLHSFKAQIAI